jgi:prepilin-type N-terminal cleavage/methylation domain-containing protein
MFGGRGPRDLRTCRLLSDRRPGRRGGHTLVEIVMVLAILAILVALGVSSARDQIGQFRLMSAARLFQSDVQSLRALAVAENREARVVIAESDASLNPAEAQVGMWLLQIGDKSRGSTVWDTLPIDEGGVADGSQGERSLDVDGSEERPGISLATPPPLAGPGLGNQDTIVFSPRGFIANPIGDFVDGFITVDFVNKRGHTSDGSAPRVRLRIARGGLAHMETSEATGLADGSVGAGGTTVQ